ncbi:MAG TPA: hypothetical protein VGI95_08920 [Caulobacteraceae bacterium]
MSSIYDLVTIVLFAGLAILFLQRSIGPPSDKDRIYHYAPPAIGCAAANWLGNEHMDVAAIAVIVASVVYAFVVLKPLKERR